MFDSVANIEVGLDSLDRHFAAGELTGRDALVLLRRFAAIRARVDGFTAKLAKRVDNTCAYMSTGDRDAAHTVSRVLGIEAGEARRALETAARLEAMPVVDAAVRAGELSARAAQLVSEAASHNPDATGELLAVARQGLDPLKDACVAARAAVEDSAQAFERSVNIGSGRCGSGPTVTGWFGDRSR